MDKEDRETGRYQIGTTACYQAEYLKRKIVGDAIVNEWVPIGIKKAPGVGVPSCRLTGELFEYMDYQSFEQAHAIAWWALANWEARPSDPKRWFEARPKVRVSVYDIEYDIKTYHRDEPIEIG